MRDDIVIADHIELVRPLITLDVETHAKVPPEQARIIELGFRVDYPDRRPPKKWNHFLDPGEPIDPDVIAVHHITDEMVFGQHRFNEIAENLAGGFTDCDFCGYNVKFDLRVIQAEFKRSNITWNWDTAYVIDTLRMWQVARPRTLSDAVREHLDREPTEAHRALGDAEDALEVGLAMLQKYAAVLPRDIVKLHEVCWPKNPTWVDSQGKIVWIKGEAAFSFGKHIGVLLKKAPRTYLEWIVRNDFPEDTKTIVGEALRGNFRTKSG